MYSILIIIDKPANASPAETQAWGRIQTKITEQLNLYENMKKISENSLEIPIDSSLPAFVNVSHIVQVEQFHYYTLFLSDKHQWVQYAPPH